MNCPKCGWQFPSERVTCGEIKTLLDIATGRPADVKVAELRKLLEEAMDSLTTKEEEVLMLRFGLWNKTPHTLRACGREFGVTPERVRQIQTKALRKLAHPSRSASFAHFIDRGPSEEEGK